MSISENRTEHLSGENTWYEQEKETKDSQMGKEVKNYPCSKITQSFMLKILKITHTHTQRKLLKLINAFSKVAGVKINRQKPVAFHTLNFQRKFQEQFHA